MYKGRVTVGFDVSDRPISVYVEFDSGVFVKIFDGEVSLNAYRNVESAYPNDFYLPLSKITDNWMSGSRPVHAHEKLGGNPDLTLRFENGRRLTVGSHALSNAAVDEWVVEHFGVHPVRKSN